MTFAGLADEFARFGDRLADVVLPKAGPMLRRTAVEAAARAGWRRMDGDTLDGAVTVRADTVALAPTPAGGWTLAESGSRKRQWWEPARPGPRSRRLRIGREVRVRVLHGPIRGRRAWTNATAAMGEQFSDVAHGEASKLWGSLGG